MRLVDPTFHGLRRDMSPCIPTRSLLPGCAVLGFSAQSKLGGVGPTE